MSPVRIASAGYQDFRPHAESCSVDPPPPDASARPTSNFSGFSPTKIYRFISNIRARSSLERPHPLPALVSTILPLAAQLSPVVICDRVIDVALTPTTTPEDFVTPVPCAALRERPDDL